MAGFWDELRAITEAEAQRSNEAFARGANIVNMLNQTTESGLGRAMNYENMAQSGLLSMANLAENSRQFDTAHKNAMELAELGFEQETALTEMRNRHAFDLAELENKYAIARQNAQNEHELNVLDKQLKHDAEALISKQNHERIQFLESLRAPNSQTVGLPTRIQIYDTIMNRGGN